MTFKLPEPDAYLVYDEAASSQYVCFDDELGDPDGLDIRPLYTADAMRDALEAAAAECESQWKNVAEKMYGQDCATAIRAMKETIK